MKQLLLLGTPPGDVELMKVCLDPTLRSEIVALMAQVIETAHKLQKGKSDAHDKSQDHSRTSEA